MTTDNRPTYRDHCAKMYAVHKFQALWAFEMSDDYDTQDRGMEPFFISGGGDEADIESVFVRIRILEDIQAAADECARLGEPQELEAWFKKELDTHRAIVSALTAEGYDDKASGWVTLREDGGEAHLIDYASGNDRTDWTFVEVKADGKMPSGYPIDLVCLVYPN